MWAFRGFRIAKVPREMCAQWFSAWTDRGFKYDITDFNSWNYNAIDVTVFVISVPVFSWTDYYTDTTSVQLALYNYFVEVIPISFINQFATAVNSFKTDFKFRIEVETYFIESIGGPLEFFSRESTRDIFNTAEFWNAAGFSSVPSQDILSVSTENLQAIFSPLQILLFDWFVKISTNVQFNEAQANTIAVAISFFTDTSLEGITNFYGFINSIFIARSDIFTNEVIQSINAEFNSESWLVSTVRWQVVSLCVGAGFPLEIIYGSLGYFIDRGFDLELLTIEWVYEFILIDRWFIEIDEIINFNPGSFDTSRAQFGFYFIELFEDFFESLGLTQAETDLYISVLVRY